MSIVIFPKYRDVIFDKIRSNQDVRGYQSLLAKAASCHISFFSHMLKGESHITLDQASGLCDFWQLDAHESEYFLTMVGYERSNSETLSLRLGQKLNELRLISEHVPPATMINVELDYKQSTQFYSSWHASVVMVAIEIPGVKTAQDLAAKVGLPLAVVKRTLDFLEELKLIVKTDEGWIKSEGELSPSRKREFVKRFHGSLRSLSESFFDRDDTRNFHATGIFAVSKPDEAKVREILLETGRMISEIVENSSAKEELCAIALDSITF